MLRASEAGATAVITPTVAAPAVATVATAAMAVAMGLEPAKDATCCINDPAASVTSMIMRRIRLSARAGYRTRAGNRCEAARTSRTARRRVALSSPARTMIIFPSADASALIPAGSSLLWVIRVMPRIRAGAGSTCRPRLGATGSGG